jgi:hypothetical protein
MSLPPLPAWVLSHYAREIRWGDTPLDRMLAFISLAFGLR